MNALDDVARFRADDDPLLVAAAFTCPLCLGLDATAQLVLEPDDAEVECSCERCSAAWSVAVTPAQAMRLELHPPAGTPGAPLRMLPARAA